MNEFYHEFADVPNLRREGVAIVIPDSRTDLDTIVKNKLKLASEHGDPPFYVEKNSFELNAYNGAPGLNSRKYLETWGSEGIYQMVSQWEDKGAVARCVSLYVDGFDKEPIRFEGRVEGTIVEPRGYHNNCYGWDTCFVPKGYNQTYAEMGMSMKNKVSHRGMVFKQLKDFLANGTMPAAS